MTDKKTKDSIASKLDPKKKYTIKGTKESKHLVTDQEYVQPAAQAAMLIDTKHATLVGEFIPDEKDKKKSE